MRFSIPLLFLVISCFASSYSHAVAANEFSDAQRIVVITEDEGIHYAQFCAFYELRDLIAGSVDNDPVPAKARAPSIYEIRVLGKFGTRTVYLGDHQMQTDTGSVWIPTDTYVRIVGLIAKREGQGVAITNVEKSVRRALKRIKNPTYVEQDHCSTK